MKKINKILFAFPIIAVLLFTSCEEQENVIYDNVNGQTLAQFVGSSGVIPVDVTGVSSTDITIQVSSVSTSDRAVEIAVDGSSTATSSQYTLSNAVIPAGEYSTTLTVTGVYAGLPEVGSVDLVLSLVSVANSNDPVVGNGTYTVKLERFCPLVISDFYGTFSQQSGFNGAAPAATIDATISAGPVDGTLLISNLHATGRSGVIELDYSDTSNPKVIHRSEEFDAVFQVAGLGNTYTEDVLGDTDKNVFSTCSKEIRLFFYRRIAQPDGRYYGGSYEVVLTKQ